MKHSGQFQPRLVHEQPILYLPGTGNSVAGRGLGPDWARAADAATVSHPAPASTFETQFRRTRVASSAGANEELGIHLPNAEDLSIWRGNAAKLGGFYFSSRFRVNAMPAAGVRFFCGLSAANVGQCIADNWSAGGVGLWCGTANAGAFQLSSSTAGGAPPTSVAYQNNPVLTVGKLYEFVMVDNPGSGSTVVTALYDLSTGTLLGTTNVGGPLPADNVFMGPQIGMSNAGLGAGYSLDIVSVYARPNLLLDPNTLA